MHPDDFGQLVAVLKRRARWAKRFQILVLALVVGATTFMLTASQAPAEPNPVTCEDYPEPRVFLGAQSWWSDSRNPFPGAHIHLDTCFPLNQTISGTVDFDVRLILHHDPGEVEWLRIQAFKNTPNQYYRDGFPLRCPVDQTCEYWFHVQFDTSQAVRDGWTEFRMTFNIGSTPEGPNAGNRQFETTRWHAFIRNGKSEACSSGGCDPSRTGAAGWYTGSDYSNVRFMRHRDAALRFMTQPQSGVVELQARGEKDVFEVAVDAANHGHDPGTVLFNGSGNDVWRTIVLDTTGFADGPHKLFLRTDDHVSSGTSSGVFVLPFTVDNGGGVPSPPPPPPPPDPPPPDPEPPPPDPEPPPPDPEPVPPECDTSDLEARIAALEAELADERAHHDLMHQQLDQIG